MKIKIFLIVLLAAQAADFARAQTPSAADLLKKVDDNEVYSTIYYEGEMTIEYQGKRFVKTMKAWARSNNDSFIEFTNPDDAGTKYLKKDGRLYVYSPDTEEVMLISGQMLKESMMGSDMSYEDVVTNATLASRYNPAITGAEIFNGRDCWLLELNAKTKTESYAKRRLWIDKENGDLVHYELYALSGAKLKQYTLDEAKVFGGRRFPVKSELSDMLRKNSKTILTMNNVILDQPIADSVFSRRNLER
ncbi:MAG: outer membrane lipoprotein-sorting protein [Spirochaetaceae bacterium]|jgi:outer membrane lipoprotein-sorting protein|nr:outer membrane lipoprotein-sorting protein [Spirochaetaceae bacterium]